MINIEKSFLFQKHSTELTTTTSLPEVDVTQCKNIIFLHHTIMCNFKTYILIWILLPT